jgi:phage/plasmid-associated DNA primase
MLTRRLIFAAIWKLPQTNGMFMGNASIIPRNYRKYLYHAYLAYMEANGYRTCSA